MEELIKCEEEITNTEIVKKLKKAFLKMKKYLI